MPAFLDTVKHYCNLFFCFGGNKRFWNNEITYSDNLVDKYGSVFPLTKTWMDVASHAFLLFAVVAPNSVRFMH
jgi:hypothetical protein